MRLAYLVAGLGLALAGCAENAAETPPPAYFASVVGTPLLIPLKIATCGATIALGAPAAGLAQLARPSPPFSGFGDEVVYGVDDGIRHNCGPPYYVTP